MSNDPKSYDVTAEEGIPVTLPSGSQYYVLTDGEREYIEDKITRYLSDNHFTNVVDLTDLDKLLVNEMLIHRWGLWLAKGRDYYDDDIPVKQFAELMNQYQTQCRGLKKALNLDKVSRDRAHGDDSIPAFWDALKQRAQEFGIMRNKQFDQVLESFMRVKAMLQFFDTTNEIERLEQHCTMEDVIEVLREEIQAFDAIDDDFKQTQQRMWIRKQ